MNRLRALSAGAGAEAGRFGGVVHSVFARACNIALDDGRLLALLAPEHGNAPNAFRLDVPAGFAFDRILRTGSRVACRAGVLRADGGALSARLAGSHRWRVGLDGLAGDPRRVPVRAAWRAALRRLVRHERDAGAGFPGLPRRRANALARAVRGGEQHRVDAAIRALVGCGRGLTPAGDDVLVGFLAGLRASAGSDAASRRSLDAIGAAVRAVAHRTNPISRAYLLHAVDGEFAEPLARLARAVATGAAPETTATDAARALAVGATSGGDGVRGLLLGFASRCVDPLTTGPCR